MRRVDQYNTHELLTVSNIIITQSFVTGPVTCDSITVHVMSVLKYILLQRYTFPRKINFALRALL